MSISSNPNDSRLRGSGLNVPRAARRLGVLTSVLVALGAGTALAAPPSITLSGVGDDGYTPDSADFATVLVNATLAGKVASGTLETGGRIGGIGNGSHYEFSGHVTCALQKGSRVIVGAFGSSAFYEERGSEETIRPLPGTYVQVTVIESGRYFESAVGSGTHAFSSLGENSRGIPSAIPPKCQSYRSLMASDGASWTDTLKQSPSITKPKDGFRSVAGTVKLAGTGEAKTSVKVYEVGHMNKALTVPVSASGKWSVTVTGLAPGNHEYVAVASGGSTVLSNPVLFTVG